MIEGLGTRLVQRYQKHMKQALENRAKMNNMKTTMVRLAVLFGLPGRWYLCFGFCS